MTFPYGLQHMDTTVLADQQRLTYISSRGPVMSNRWYGHIRRVTELYYQYDLINIPNLTKLIKEITTEIDIKEIAIPIWKQKKKKKKKKKSNFWKANERNIYWSIQDCYAIFDVWCKYHDMREQLAKDQFNVCHKVHPKINDVPPLRKKKKKKKKTWHNGHPAI